MNVVGASHEDAPVHPGAQTAARDDGNACTADVCGPSTGRDLAVMADAWNSRPGDVRYAGASNPDQGTTVPDACIDMTDFHLLMNTFGNSCH